MKVTVNAFRVCVWLATTKDRCLLLDTGTRHSWVAQFDDGPAQSAMSITYFDNTTVTLDKNKYYYDNLIKLYFGTDCTGHACKTLKQLGGVYGLAPSALNNGCYKIDLRSNEVVVVPCSKESLRIKSIATNMWKIDNVIINGIGGFTAILDSGSTKCWSSLWNDQEIKVEIERHKSKLKTFKSSQRLPADIVLGLPWFVQNSLILDFETKAVTLV